MQKEQESKSEIYSKKMGLEENSYEENCKILINSNRIMIYFRNRKSCRKYIRKFTSFSMTYRLSILMYNISIHHKPLHPLYLLNLSSF